MEESVNTEQVKELTEIVNEEVLEEVSELKSKGNTDVHEAILEIDKTKELINETIEKAEENLISAEEEPDLNANSTHGRVHFKEELPTRIVDDPRARRR